MSRRVLNSLLVVSVLGAAAVLVGAVVQAPARARYARALALIEEAQEEAARGDRKGSRLKVEEAYALCPENPKVRRERGLHFLTRGRYAEATEELRVAADLQPGDPGAAWELAFALSAAGRADESIVWFRHVIGRERNNGVAYAMIANAHVQQGRAAEALRAAQTGVELSPRVALTHFALGTAYWLAKDYEKGRRALEEALALRPSDVRTLLALAALTGEAKRPELAVGYLERAVRLAPNDPVAWAGLGEAYRRCQQPHRAEEALDRALALDPNNAQARGSLAQLGPRGGERAK